MAYSGWHEQRKLHPLLRTAIGHKPFAIGSPILGIGGRLAGDRADESDSLLFSHGSLNGQIPIELLHAKSEDTPFRDEVEAKYDLSGECFHVSHYQTDLALQRHAQAQQEAGSR